MITNYIIPKFGALRLADLTPAKVRAWFLELEAEEYSGAMIAKVEERGLQHVEDRRSRVTWCRVTGTRGEVMTSRNTSPLPRCGY